MVLVKRICPPERRKAIIAVAAKPSSPTLSVYGNSPDGQQLEVGDEWVLGCNPVDLVFEDRTEDSTFWFVE